MTLCFMNDGVIVLNFFVGHFFTKVQMSSEMKSCVSMSLVIKRSGGPQIIRAASFRCVSNTGVSGERVPRVK
jgi:hypothetical protein